MKRQFLSLGFALILMTLLGDYLQNAAIIFFVLFYLAQAQKKKIFLCGLLLVVFNVQFVKREAIRPKTNEVIVEDIRTNYIIASDQGERVLLYDVVDANLRDKLKIHGTYEVIHSNQNTDIFQFATYMQRKGITKSMNVKYYRTLAKSKSFQAKTYAKIRSIKDEKTRAHLLKTFYKIDENRQDLSYLVQASGFHISFLISLFAKRFMINRNILALFFCIAYIVFFPLPFFIIRIFCFACVSLLCKHFNDKDRLGIAIIVLLLLNKNYLYELGFVLSVLFSLLRCFQLRKLPRILTSSLLLLPVQLFYFYECNLLQVFCFPFLRWLSSLLFLLSCFSVFFSFFNPFLHFGITIMDESLRSFSMVYSLIGKPPFWWFLIYLAFFYSVISNMRVKKITFICLLLYQIHMSKLNFFGEILFIDVGQGDSMLIYEPMNGEVVLIDVAGNLQKDIATDIIYPMLKVRGIRSIDKVLISHADFDHSGGLKELQKKLPIDSVIYGREDVQLKYTKLTSLNTKKWNDENDDSQVWYGNFFGLRFLFTGDASEKVERDILDRYNRLNVDILKVTHHGSRTGTSEIFIQQIKPMLSVISSGYHNRYGHPHPEVTDVLKAYDSTILDTQRDGSVSIYFSRYLKLYRTGARQFGILKKAKE